MILWGKFMQLAGMHFSLLLTRKQAIRRSHHPWQNLTSSCERILSGKFITVFIDETEWNLLRKVSYLGDHCIQKKLNGVTEVVNIQWSTSAYTLRAYTITTNCFTISPVLLKNNQLTIVNSAFTAPKMSLYPFLAAFWVKVFIEVL